MNLKSLKTYISQRLMSESGINVYSIKPPTTESEDNFPYLTYKFTSLSNDDSNQDNRILEIDYWSNNNDDGPILDASELVRQDFHYSWQSEIEGFFTMFLDFEGEIPDTEENICRINQRYLIKARRV
jgi:hypothetical protein